MWLKSAISMHAFRSSIRCCTAGAVAVVLFMLIPALRGFAAAQPITLMSPDKNIRVEIFAGEQLAYRVSFGSSPITGLSALSLTLGDGHVLGAGSRIAGVVTRSVNQDVQPLYGMASVYHDQYNEVSIRFRDNFSVLFRAYNNGVAYRFVTNISGRIKVKDEQVSYAFQTNVTASMMRAPNYLYSYEEHYTDSTISALDSGKRAALPLYANAGAARVVLTESDLLDYPALYFTYDGHNGLKGVLPAVVVKDSIGGCCPNFEKIPYERADYLAETEGKRSFPWRLMVIASNDRDLLYNNLVYLLASPSKIGDSSWIRPGKVAWDWWSANNLTGVSFKTGFNTDTYKYFIDFAAANGIEYINMDEGWSSQFDLLKLNNGDIHIGSNAGGGLDMPYLFDYAKKKNVGIILWCVWHTLDRQMDSALNQFEKWGVKGLKVDFMDRDDQAVVNFYQRLATAAARKKMLVNFHGACKPTGLERTYPNIINREAVQGLEFNKFSDKCTPEHAAHIPFIRMVAGSMDYTPGGLYNASKGDFRVVNERPMTQGTRCQQLSMFTLFYAPLEMLSDAPTAYEREPDILRYLAAMPTTWDETRPLDGAMGDYAVVARRKGSDWFVAGLTDWTARKLTVHFDFLTDKRYRAEIFSDGENANRNGNDYRRTIKTLTAADSLVIEMAPGGGFAIRLRSEDQTADSTALVSLLQTLAAKEKNPLLARHFTSVRQMLTDTTHAGESFRRKEENLHEVLEFFRHEGSAWNTYANGPRPLIMSFKSPADQRNSYYWLFLPKQFDRSKTNYPFYMELHGSGGGENDDPWHMLLQPLRQKIAGVTSQGYRKEGLFILPWGRGDKGYSGIAETDIFECLKDFDGMFTTDRQRQYLFGFSMGGAGTLHIAEKSLNRWTAIGMYSAAFRSVSQEEADSVRKIPIWMAWGEEEPWAVNDRILKDCLLKAGADVNWQEVPGVGHNYLGEYQEKLMDWFLQHSTRHF